MVSGSDHLLPFAAVLLSWFASTALIVRLANKPRATYGKNLLLAAAAGVAGLLLILATRHDTGVIAAYLSFAGALLIWGWQEFAFLTGAIAGPRRTAADPEARGTRRFSQAAAALLWHELALAGVAVLLVAISVRAENQVGAFAFVILFMLRLLAKFAIFAGALNLHADLMPPQLRYLRSYFGPERVSMTSLIALALGGVLSVALAISALGSSTGGAAVAASLLFALASLGTLELLFLVIPVRDSALWRWALPEDRSTNAWNTAKGMGHGL